jgi:hypothetical protein
MLVSSKFFNIAFVTIKEYTGSRTNKEVARMKRLVGILMILLCASQAAYPVQKKYMRPKFKQVMICILNDYKYQVAEETIEPLFAEAQKLFPPDIAIKTCLHGWFYGDYDLEYCDFAALIHKRCSVADFTAVVTNASFEKRQLPELFPNDYNGINKLCGLASDAHRFMVVLDFEAHQYKYSGKKKLIPWTAVTIAHEIGHLMGAEHSLFPDSVMYPYLNRTKGDIRFEQPSTLRKYSKPTRRTRKR